MNNDLKVSIILPVYNTEKYLPKCLDSIQAQTLKEIEIICINDGSTDNSLNILKEYADRDSRFKIISQTNSGQSAARNKGLDFATGKYVGFVDSDDYIEPGMYEKLFKNATENKSDISLCSMSTYTQTTGVFNTNVRYFSLNIFPSSFDGKVFNYKDTDNFLFRICVSPCNKLYKKELIKDNNISFPEGLFFEDNVFFYETFMLAKRISLIRDNLYCYRLKSDTSTVTGDDKNKLDFFEVFKKIEDFFKEHGFLSEFEEDFSTYKKNTLIYWYKKISDKTIQKEFANRFYTLYSEYPQQIIDKQNP